MKWSLDYFQTYLLGHCFKVCTDNNPLMYFLTSPNIDTTKQRWINELVKYDFSFEYQKYKNNTVVDALNRIKEACLSDRQRLEEIAREVIRSGEFDHPVNPDRDVRLDRNNQDDWSLSYSIRDIPTFDGKGDSLPHTHMMEFGDFLANTGSEIRYLPQEPWADDREHHIAVVKDVVNKFKVSLKGKPRLWFEMQYPTSADEPKTKEAYEKMIASFITEHNAIGSTREQQIMAWKI